MNVVKCPNCGEWIPEDADYCPFCGCEFEDDSSSRDRFGSCDIDDEDTWCLLDDY